MRCARRSATASATTRARSNRILQVPSCNCVGKGALSSDHAAPRLRLRISVRASPRCCRRRLQPTCRRAGCAGSRKPDVFGNTERRHRVQATDARAAKGVFQATQEHDRAEGVREAPELKAQGPADSLDEGVSRSRPATAASTAGAATAVARTERRFRRQLQVRLGPFPRLSPSIDAASQRHGSAKSAWRGMGEVCRMARRSRR
jgi:hypothetical protein